MSWTAEFHRQFIDQYRGAVTDYRITFCGSRTDVAQRLKVSRWPERQRAIGEVWYDLYFNGVVSDVTATFYICVVPGGLVLSLNDVHVM
jgi:hypothetical protein